MALIRTGRIDRSVEFGYKAQVSDIDDSIVLDYAGPPSSGTCMS